MSAVFALFRLQQVDSQIAQAEARRRKIQETLENDSALQAALQKFRAGEQEERTHEQARRSAEESARELQVKIQQAESSLYRGKVHNPKELQELQADIASLKKHLASIEEQELEAMVRLEAAQERLKAYRGELEAAQGRQSFENRQLLDEQADLDQQLQSLASQRQAALSSVDAPALSVYEALRKERRGMAVAEVRDNACGACGTILTAMLQQSARHSTDLMRCPSCGRILFAP